MLYPSRFITLEQFTLYVVERNAFQLRKFTQKPPKMIKGIKIHQDMPKVEGKY